MTHTHETSTLVEGPVREIQVKVQAPDSDWVWGAFRMPGSTLAALHSLWLSRDRREEYIGTLVNAYISNGGAVSAVKAGETYVDVGTLHGYHEAVRVLMAADLAAV